MSKTYNEIINKIDNHIKNSGRNHYSDFYIGISNDAANSLFNEHRVDKNNSWWIYTTADNEKTAENVKSYYINLGMRGHLKFGNGNMVYCYVVTPLTTE